MAGFEHLGISEERSLALQHSGIREATPIQEEAIPAILRGSDVICQAQTGTGKTLAFLLPMLERLRPDKDELQGLILTPTRELALQITEELKRRLASNAEFRVLAVYGGQDVEAQMRKLKSAVHIVVATPGRLLDHMRRETISLGKVKMLVLDEADQMLHLGFLNEVEEILSRVPYRRQTMLFSATMPASVRELAARIMQSPQDITVRAPKVTVKGVRQLVVETTDRGKQDSLRRMIEEQGPYLGVIFCRTKRRAAALNEALQEMGFASDELHGDLSQSKREQVMKRFRDAKLQLLVATDVAARGLDVEGVTHVYNYDIPHDAEGYIHRIGRTARAGGEGAAITFVAPKDRPELAAIERGIGQTLERRAMSGRARTADDADASPHRPGEDGSRARRGGRAAEDGRPARSGKAGGSRAAGAGRGRGASAAAAPRGGARRGESDAWQAGERVERGRGASAAAGRGGVRRADGDAGRSGGRAGSAGGRSGGGRAGGPAEEHFEWGGVRAARSGSQSPGRQSRPGRLDTGAGGSEPRARTGSAGRSAAGGRPSSSGSGASPSRGRAGAASARGAKSAPQPAGKRPRRGGTPDAGARPGSKRR